MFQARDYSIFLPSPNAERAFLKLRRLDFLVNGLIGLLILLCVWNVAKLAQLRMIENQDLADVRSITDDLSTKLIWIVTPLTLAIIAIREWLIGERTFGVVYPLTALLAIILVPATMTEIQPPLEEQTLRVVINECPPKAIVNDRLSSIGRCQPFPIEEDDVILALSDPTDDSFRTLGPASGGQNTIAYTFSGRGTYTVYFMFRFDDTISCEQSTILPRGLDFSSVNNPCIEHNGSIWKVMPHTTAANKPSGIHLVLVTIP